MRRAIGYIRSSSPAPVEITKLETYCNSVGLKLCELLIDAHAADRLPFEDRPEGSRYFRVAREHKARTLVAFNIFGLFRDPADAQRQVRRLRIKKHDLHLVDLGGQPYIMSGKNHHDVFAATVDALGRLAKLDPAKLGALAMGKLRVLGYKRGHTPYGSRLEGDLLVMEPAEQRVIEEMQRQRQAGATFEAIARGLNSSGVPTKKGGKWHPTTVQNILKAGDQHAVGRRRRVLRGP